MILSQPRHCFDQVTYFIWLLIYILTKYFKITIINRKANGSAQRIVFYFSADAKPIFYSVLEGNSIDFGSHSMTHIFIRFLNSIDFSTKYFVLGSLHHFQFTKFSEIEGIFTNIKNNGKQSTSNSKNEP